MVMATPFLHALRACSYDEIWAVGKTSAIHLYNGLNLFDRLISVEDKGITAFFDTTNLLKKADFKRAIALPHSFRSAFFFYNLHIKERIGYARNKRGFMLTQKIEEKGDGPEPTVERYLRIVDALGINRSLDAPILLVTDDEDEKFDEKFADVKKPYCVFVTGAQYGPSKCWPHEHFSGLADKIVEKYGMKIYMLPGKDEEKIARKVREGAKNKDSIEIKSMNVRDLKVCLSRASFVVSNDTGPRHISAALSVPTIVLLGPMDDRYTIYPGTFTHKLWREDMPCRPCNKKECNKGHECLEEILPDEVFKTIGGIIEKTEDNQ
jgi:heptosyltransferase II